MFWSLIWGAITGNLGSIISGVTSTVKNLSDNDTKKLEKAIGADKDVALAQLQTAHQTYQTRTDFLKGLRITQWLLAGALVPPLYNAGMIYLDATPFFYIWFDGFFPVLKQHVIHSWHAVPLTDPKFLELQLDMIKSLLGIQGGLTVGMGFAKALMRR